jgi:hypothetical protein
MIATRRPLEEVIGELADGILALNRSGAVRPTCIDLKLPVETRVEDTPHGPSVVADLPRLHTRTYFDLPLGRLTLTIGEIPAEALS